MKSRKGQRLISILGATYIPPWHLNSPEVAAMIGILVALVIFGLLFYLLQSLPIDPVIKQIIRGIASVLIILWLLYTFVPFAGSSVG